jgi:hypothetical protein
LRAQSELLDMMPAILEQIYCEQMVSLVALFERGKVVKRWSEAEFAFS